MLNGVWSSSAASSSWSKSWSTSPLRSGTLAIERTPTPGGMRTQRSGAITPRRAAWARSKREVCVGKRSVTWRAISAPVAVMPMKTGPDPLADRGAGLLAERGVGLVADDDRVGVGDVAGVAHEPLVGLDGHGTARRRLVAVLEQRRPDALLVAAVAQLAQELVDQVAAVGEDQDAAGARGLDEAHRGHGLAGAGGVLEPEAAGGARVLAAASAAASSSASSAGSQSSGSSSASVLVALDLVLAGVGSSSAPRPGPRPFGASWPICSSAVSAISVPESASTWCAFRTSCRRPGAAPPRSAAARGRASASSVASPLDRGL